MRILLVNHGAAGAWGGGDGVQIRETGKRLQQRGHEVVGVNADQPDCRGFDLVHLFNCRVEGSFHQQMASCKAAGVPVVVSPIWISLARALWGSRGSTGCCPRRCSKGKPPLGPYWNNCANGRWWCSWSTGPVNAEGNGDCCWPLNRERLRQLLREADGLLPNSWLELQALRSDLQWDGDCFEIAHYGVDPSLFLDADPEPFRQHTGVRGAFVMQAGRIEPGKNQAMLCWALRHTDIPIVLIGGSKHWPSYAELCRSISGSRLTVIDHMPQPLLASAYAAAAVHTLPSWMETCGLVSLEAALSGTPLWGAPSGTSWSIWKLMPGMPTPAMRPASETLCWRRWRQVASIPDRLR